MIYTEEDLKQAYDMGYNEAVDDVNAYIEQDSTEFSLDESYDEDYSAVEDAIMNETKSVNKEKHDKIVTDYYNDKHHNPNFDPNEEVKKYGVKQTLLRHKALKDAIDKRWNGGKSIPHAHVKA
nr:MAG TPA: hypothetical protein [Caudoviricetes sp.]